MKLIFSGKLIIACIEQQHHPFTHSLVRSLIVVVIVIIVIIIIIIIIYPFTNQPWNSQLTPKYIITTQYSPLTTHHSSSLTTYHSSLTIHHPPSSSKSSLHIRLLQSSSHLIIHHSSFIQHNISLHLKFYTYIHTSIHTYIHPSIHTSIHPSIHTITSLSQSINHFETPASPLVLSQVPQKPRSDSHHPYSSLSTFKISSATTAKLSSPLLLPRTVSYDASSKPPRPSGPYRTMSDNKVGRRRRSSSLLYQEPPETIEHMSDQAALPNLNANWVNAKGAWTIHLVLIACLKILFDIIPGVSQETSWTLTNISYMFGSFLMFHWVRGVPFEFNAGAYDNLNMWEQIDNGAQYTPAKKFLMSVPIVLFLISTHYTHYDLTYFIINFLAVLGVVIPKLPYSHRTRGISLHTIRRLYDISRLSLFFLLSDDDENTLVNTKESRIPENCI
ncbi:hypothetical protein EYC84_010821 [Monilinia fructicola]|uniref:Uncharacterized protein n=1 Tax=Monilinia fructicola TaxID=38448 RepID=A0A5M9JAZ8_MONFR|nr:hypothetical protein EYC84_010821 [Monilinia fructicola]